MHWEDAEVPEYNNYTKRLESFESWPCLKQENTNAQKTFVTPQTMAANGFYFSGYYSFSIKINISLSSFILGPNDGVTCFYCGNTLINWESSMDSTNEKIVQLEHARFFPCRFITHIVGAKFVANAGYFHVVSSEGKSMMNTISKRKVF